MHAGRILIADDSSTNRMLLSGILEDAGYHVRAAASGREALTLARSEPPELILLDIQMPEMDGLEACRRLKEDPATRSLPVLFISALDDVEAKVTAFDAGGVDYVTKPFEAAEVLARVGTQLQVSRLSRETQAKKEELERAYAELKRAQEQIARLEAPDAARLESTERWAQETAEDVRRETGARTVGVWTLRGERFAPLAAEGQGEPDWSGLIGEELVELESGTWAVAIPGASGETRGAVVVEGKAVFSDVERNMLRSFARHLGTALEMRRFRAELHVAEARRAESRHEMRGRGVAPVDICPLCGGCYSLETGPEDEAPVCPEDGTPLDSSLLLPYRVASRYRLMRVLGEGGMGTVFSAHDEKLSRDVALKVLRPETLSDPTARFRFEREARAMARVRHPGVVALHDNGELPDGGAFLVLELLAGRDLDSVLLDHGAGRPDQVASILRQIGAALGAVHRAGVVHRDIKPANVFLLTEESGHPAPRLTAKLLDFGIARGNQAGDRLTQTGLITGTPAYMSPEQVQGDEVDERSDIYSLAAVAYEALIGAPAIPQDGHAGVLVAVLTVKPQRPSVARKGLPAELDATFEAALAKERDQRPTDVAAWAEECAQILEGLPPAAFGPGWPAELKKARPKRTPNPWGETVSR